MSDPAYKNVGSPAIRIIEECGEAIQAVCKGDRFGWDGSHPDRPDRTNLQELEKEISDVVEAFEDLKKSLPFDDDDDDNAWLCHCGNYQVDGHCHCSICGAEAPWGCDCGYQEEMHGG